MILRIALITLFSSFIGSLTPSLAQAGTCPDYDLSGTYRPIANSLIGDRDRSYVIEQIACELKIKENRSGAEWTIRFDPAQPAAEIAKKIVDHNVKLAGQEAQDFFNSVQIGNWTSLSTYTQPAHYYERFRSGLFTGSFTSKPAFDATVAVGLRAIFAESTYGAPDSAMIRFQIEWIELVDSSLLPTVLTEHTSVLATVNSVLRRLVTWASQNERNTLVELQRIHR